MMIRIERSKGGVDRDVPLSQKLLTALREYYRWMRPKTYLFPVCQAAEQLTAISQDLAVGGGFGSCFCVPFWRA
jgi:integrase